MDFSSLTRATENRAMSKGIVSKASVVSRRPSKVMGQKTIQKNFNGFNGTMKMCSRQGQFELMSVSLSARSGGIMGISFHFL